MPTAGNPRAPDSGTANRAVAGHATRAVTVGLARVGGRAHLAQPGSVVAGQALRAVAAGSAGEEAGTLDTTLVRGALEILSALDRRVIVAVAAAADVPEATLAVVRASVPALPVDAEELSTAAVLPGAALRLGPWSADTAPADLIGTAAVVGGARGAAVAVDAESTIVTVGREDALVTGLGDDTSGIDADLPFNAVAVRAAAQVHTHAILTGLSLDAVTIGRALGGRCGFAESVDAGLTGRAVHGRGAGTQCDAGTIDAELGLRAVSVGRAVCSRCDTLAGLTYLAARAVSVAVTVGHAHTVVADAVFRNTLIGAAGGQTLESARAVPVRFTLSPTEPAVGLLVQIEAERTRTAVGVSEAGVAELARNSRGLRGDAAVACPTVVTGRAVDVPHALSVIDHGHVGDRRRDADTGVLALGVALVPAPPRVAIGVADVPTGRLDVSAAIVVDEEAAGSDRGERGTCEEEEQGAIVHWVTSSGRDPTDRIKRECPRLTQPPIIYSPCRIFWCDKTGVARACWARATKRPGGIPL